MRVVAEARSWLKTPFRHKARIKGSNGGVDCAHLLCEVYERAACTPHIEPEDYVIQTMLHGSEERFLPVMEAHGREIDPSDAREGDAVIFRCGRSYSHGAILIEPWPGLLIHACNGFGVQLAHGTKDGFLSGRRERKFYTLVGNR